MTKQFLYLIGGFVLGVLLTLVTPKILEQSNSHQRIMTENKPSTSMTGVHGSSMSMDEMVEMLKDVTGDDFDKAFVEMMIDHHQGAIDMAKLSEERAKHQEIKDLSKAIIEAQNKEIKNMQEWQKAWNY